MSVFNEWLTAYSADAAAIDKGHDAMLALIHDLSGALAAGKAPAEVTPKLHALAAEMRSHFEEEEQILERNGFPELEAHQAEHGAIREELDRIEAALKAKPDEIPAELGAFLTNTLAAHMADENEKYLQHISGIAEKLALL